MAFMVPTASYFTAEEAAECTADPDFGAHVSASDYEAGWYGRLSAPGYMDCTDWQGPFPKAWMAIRYVCRTFDVDTNGDPAE